MEERRNKKERVYEVVYSIKHGEGELCLNFKSWYPIGTKGNTEDARKAVCYRKDLLPSDFSINCINYLG